MSKAAQDFDYDELFPGRFMKAGEFKSRDVTLRIASVTIEEMPDKKGTKKNREGVLVKVKPLVSFTTPKGRPVEKMLVLNRTNAECIKGMFGRRTKDWIGKLVTFCPRMVEAFGGEELAIRVRGSPDIDGDIQVEIKLGQKTRKAKMVRTEVYAAAAKAGLVVAPEPEPEHEEDATPQSAGGLEDDDTSAGSGGLLDEEEPTVGSEQLVDSNGKPL